MTSPPKPIRKTSDISDRQVVAAALAYQRIPVHAVVRGPKTTIDHLIAAGAPEKVARNAIERAYGRGFVDVGLGPDWAWPTEAGLRLLDYAATSAEALQPPPPAATENPAGTSPVKGPVKGSGAITLSD